MAFQNAGLDILNYLWLPGFIPYNNINKIVPDTNLKSTYDAYKVANILESALQNHPKLNAIQSKINALNYEQKAKIQDLLPKIDLKGNVLYKKYNFNLPVDNTYLFENNKVGIDIRMPLFIREARGAYKNVKLKIKETEYDMSYNTAIISNKIKSYYNEITSLEKQVGFFTQNYQNIAKLYNAEITKLMAGESTLFLVNNRENKLLETKQKLIELQTKYQKSFYSLYWSAGILQ
ncbi:MAG: TolC family protein [Chitinophagia bacterium]|nr:TolC family protein [Chitinophagia bacterium]